MLHLTALKVFMVTDDVTGKVDYKASRNKLDEQLAEYELRNGEEDTMAGRAINAIFEQYKGSTLSTKFIVGNALSELKATPDNYKTFTEALERYLKVNCGDAGVALFGAKKGCGIFRHSDKVATI